MRRDELSRRRILQGALTLPTLGLIAACTSSASATPTAKAVPTSPSNPTASPGRTAQPASGQAKAGAPKATAAPANPSTMTKLTVALNAGTFANAPLWAADKAGLFRAAGLQLEWPEFQNGNLIIRAVLAGETTTGIVSVQPIFSAIDQGSQFTIVAAPMLRQPFCIATRKDINSLEDLYGKEVGTNGPGAGLENFMIALYQAKGLDPSKLVFVNIGQPADQLKALSAGKIVAGVVNSGQISQVEALANAKILVKGWEVLTTWIRFGMPIRPQTMTEQDDALKRYFVALSQAYRWTYDHRAEVIAAGIEGLQYTQAFAEAAYDDLIDNGMMNPDLSFTEEQVRYMQQLNVDAQQQKAILPFDKVADLRYVKYVQDTLGPFKR